MAVNTRPQQRLGRHLHELAAFSVGPFDFAEQAAAGQTAGTGFSDSHGDNPINVCVLRSRRVVGDRRDSQNGLKPA